MRATRVLRILLILALSLQGHAAFAQSVAGCGTGNQDSTCLTPLRNAPQTPSTCPSEPGVTTVTPAVWIGSQYTQPQCNVQAQPTCPSGDITLVAAAWTGATWTQPVCEAPPPPVITPPTPVLASCSVEGETGFGDGGEGGSTVGIEVSATVSPAQAGVTVNWTILQSGGPTITETSKTGNFPGVGGLLITIPDADVGLFPTTVTAATSAGPTLTCPIPGGGF